MPKKNGILKIILCIVVVLVIAVVTIFLVKKFVLDKDDTNTIIDNTPVEHNLNELKFDKYTKVENGVIINKSEKIKEDKIVDEFTISNYELTYEHGTILIGTVKNNSNVNITERTNVIIKFLDEQGNEIGNMMGSIPPVDAGDTVQINTSTSAEIMNVYDVKVEKMQ